MKNIEFRCSYADDINNRGFGKPNEDRYICDNENGVFAVFDGVTRPHGEYENKGSMAADVAKLLCDSVLSDAKTLGNAESIGECEKMLRSSLLRANEKVREYNRKCRWEYAPAAVGIAAVLCGDTLCFAYAGDCSGFLVRNGAKIEFSQQQTAAVKLKKLSKDEMYSMACNNPGWEFGYGLFNGDDALGDMLTVSHLTLEKGDTVYLCSDGLYAFMKYGDSGGMTDAGEVIRASAPFDMPPFASYADDKAIIVLSF